MPHTDMDVSYLVYLLQRNIQPHPNPFHNLYSVERADNMRTCRKMNSEADTWKLVQVRYQLTGKKKKVLALGNSLDSPKRSNIPIKC